MAASVKDTAAWRLIVPLRPALNLTGSRLIATATAAFGGMVVQLDSGAGSITWIADHATGLTDALTVVVPVAARGGWQALGANGRPGVVTVFVDVLRGVGGAVPEEDLGRTSFAVFPGTASPAVASPTGGLQPVLSAIPCGGILLSALQTGPQGPAGGDGVGGKTTLTASTVLSGHKVVRVLPDGTADYASADQPAQAGTVLGLSLAAAQAGAPVQVAITGPIDEPSWSFAPGPVWLGLAGALTQTAPQAGLLQQVGLALTPTRLLVGLAPPILL